MIFSNKKGLQKRSSSTVGRPTPFLDFVHDSEHLRNLGQTAKPAAAKRYPLSCIRKTTLFQQRVTFLFMTNFHKVLIFFLSLLPTMACSKEEQQADTILSTPISPLNYNGLTNFEYSPILTFIGDTLSPRTNQLIDTVVVSGESRLVVYGRVYSCDTGHYVFNQNFIQLRYDNHLCQTIAGGVWDTTKFRFNPPSNLYPWNLTIGTVWQREHKWSNPVGIHGGFESGSAIIDYQVTNIVMVTTPAGTFECLESTRDTSNYVFGERLYTSSFGLVKSENYYIANDSLVSEFVLTRIY